MVHLPACAGPRAGEHFAQSGEPIHQPPREDRHEITLRYDGKHAHATIAGPALWPKISIGSAGALEYAVITMPRVAFTANIQRHAECPPADAVGTTVREVLESYFAGNERARGYVLDDQGALRHH